ncbi:MAG: AMP-binding protein, partial [Candidatus Aminicenantes bacterium]
TPNGKVDRKALPKPEIGVESIYAAPVNQIQEKLVEIWSRVLGIQEQRISIDSNFFRLGGHSLNAAVIISKIHKVFNVKLSLVELFNFSTIRGMSAIIAQAAEDKYITIEPVEKREYYNLSSAQMRLFILHQVEPNSINYNISQLVVLESTAENDVDIMHLERTFSRLVQRHESLRTSFEIIDDQPVQRIHDQVDFKIEYDDLATEDTESTEESHHSSFIIHHFVRPFDLSRAPLLRVGLMEPPHNPAALRGHPQQGTYNSQEGKKKQYILIIDMHHIISDGVSMGIIIEEFVPLYANAQLPGLRLQYRDYSGWQNKTNVSKRIKQQEEYWLKQFDRETPLLNLPIDYPRPAIRSFAGNTLHFEIGEEETKALKSLALKEKVTLFMLLLSITNIFLSKLSSQEEVMVGTPIAARRHADLQRIIGMFVNTLVLRNRPHRGKTFKQFLNDVKEITLRAYENQEYPFEKLVEKVSMHKDTSRNPLFDVIFALQNMEIPGLEIPGLKLKPYEYGNKVSKFDLAFNGVEKKGRLVFTVEYCTKLFKEETILRFIKCFKNITAAVLENPEQKIIGISVIPEEEKHRILYEFIDTVVEYPKNKTIHELFTEQAEQTPDHIALIGAHELHELHEERTRGLTPLFSPIVAITYRELNQKSNQLAHLLKEKGIASDAIVAIMMEHSVDMIIGILGILKAGGAYLPIDPGYPEERINYMLTDSNTKFLVTTP